MTTNKTKWIKEFDKEFGSSDFWLNNTNYPRNYHTIKAFILSTLQEYSKEVEKKADKCVISNGIDPDFVSLEKFYDFKQALHKLDKKFGIKK